jgi:uncharacterized protein involved in response to NO
MSSGFMPLFIVGFFFTAGPRWLGLPEVSAHTLRWPVLLMLIGSAWSLVGFHVHAIWAGLGVALVSLGWSRIVGRQWTLLRASPSVDKLHATLLVVAGGVGVCAVWTAALALVSGHLVLLRLAVHVVLWMWLAPTFVVVSHRMLPFFTASALPLLDAWRPNWLLWVMFAAVIASGCGTLAEVLWPGLPERLRWFQLAIEGPAAALLLALAVRWGVVQSLKIRLLAMLHVGFVWLGAAMALAALSHGWQALGGPGLGLAPLHALTMGYLGTTLVAMITRVASGHSGRPLAVDNVAWRLFGVLQLAVVARIASELWPSAYWGLLLTSVIAWSVATTAWAWRYGGWLGRPRVDGRPG